MLYRHGERLSTVHSGDHATARRDHPGALHLLRWRAIQLAHPRGAGRDGPRRRRRRGRSPRTPEGEPMWGLYQHKLSFGGEWLELSRSPRARDPTEPLPGRPTRGSHRPYRRAGWAVARDAAERSRNSSRRRNPTKPRPLGELIDRLAVSGSLRGAREGGRAIGPAALAPILVRGVTDDTRACGRTTCSSRCGRPRRRARVRRAGATPPVRRRDRRAAGAGGRPAAARRRPDHGRARRRGRLVVRRPQSRARCRRDHGHGRQDDDLVPRGRGPRGRRPVERARRDRRNEDRRDARAEPGAHDHAWRSGPPARATSDGRRRERRRRRRDDVPRPGRRPRAGDRLRRRDLDEPHPRASRVPRDVGGLSGRQAVAVRAPRRVRAEPAQGARRRPGRRRRSSTSTTRAPACSSASPRRPARGSSPTAPTRRPTSGQRTARRTRGGSASATTAPSGAARASSSASPAGSTSTTRSRSSPSARHSSSIRQPSERASSRSRACPAGWSGSMRGSRSAVVIDYAHSPASLEAVLGILAPARGGPRRRPDRRVRVGRASGTRKAPDDGPDRGRAGPPRRS